MHTKWQAFSSTVDASEIGFFKLPSLGILVVSGSDTETFLQGQLTVNLKTVTSQQSQLGAHCNLKGRMQSLFRIIKLQQGEQSRYLLVAAATLIPHAIQNLKKYAIFSKVSLDQTQELCCFGFVGEQSTNYLATLMEDAELNTLPIGGTRSLPQAEGDIVICRLPGTLSRFLVIIPSTLSDHFMQIARKTTHELPAAKWELLDIQAGIPSLYPNTEDLLLPHHVNLPKLQGVSFDKGCYVGQEIIARMHYKGKIKRHMYRALLTESTEAPCPGDHIVILEAPNEAPGIVVRAAEVDQGYELLIVLDEQYADFIKIRFKKATGPKLYRLS